MVATETDERSVLRARLAARANELRGEISDETPRAEPRPREPGDSGDAAAARAREAVDDAQLERDRDELLRVLEAMRRLDDGSYGRCIDCGADIEPRRLQALPSAERCASCQAHREGGGDDGFLVLDAVHRRTLLCLDDLETLVESLADKGPSAQSRVRAARIRAWFDGPSRRHHEDEERHVFPPLLASGDAVLAQKVLQLQQDHFWLEEDWRQLEPMLAAIADGVGAWDLAALRDGVQVLVALHRDHIALEEGLIYPKARERIGLAGRREMGREMAQRRRR